MSANAGKHQADLELLRRAKEGEPGSVEGLMERLSCVPALVRGRAKRLGLFLKPDEVEEATQNTLLVVWRKMGAYDGRAALETWVYGMVVFELFKLLDRRRAAQEISNLDEEIEPAGQDNPSPVDSDAVAAALDRIGPPGDEIVRLKHFEDLTFEEIGKRLETHPKTVMTRYYRTLERLRVLLQAEVGGTAT